MVNLNEFSRIFAKRHGITYPYGAEICKDVFQLLCEVLHEAGEDVVLNNYCSFRHKHTPVREVRHPATGEPVMVPSHDIIKFRVSDTFKSSLEESEEEMIEENE